MTSRTFAASLLAIVLLALALRTVFPTADPPWRSTVGIVWHDEGAWTHNARNKVLFGTWRADEWNPVYIAPVFTAFEYASFASFGVGLRQARLVSAVAGVISVLLLALGVRRVAGPAAGLIAGALAAANYVYVMYDRAALMEALMVAFIVASWYCSTLSERRPVYGALAATCAVLAFFTKAAAAFYIGAIAVALVASAFRRKAIGRHEMWACAGFILSAGTVAALFVVPHWNEYQFYNWQVSVTRKPSYDVASIVMRLSWFPILHDTFSRMWVALVLAAFGAWGIAARWRRATAAELLLLLWLVLGCVELLVHDVGNERRFVFLIPVLIALASIVIARGSLLPAEALALSRRHLLLASPALFYAAYVIAGAAVRVAFLADIHANQLRWPVRAAAVAAVVLGSAVLASWPRARVRWTTTWWGTRTAAAFAAIAVTWNLAQFAEWARYRTYENYDASIALGRVLPPGTPVQGKLANGLALENGIRPIFIGHEFGNYADRKQRWDVRYILTYTDPYIGFEGDQIVDVLEAYPGWRTIMTFDVSETPSGHDTAALIEKRARD